jgi:phospholipid/cholesterol/gamma-HCH transport system substrate-binding protein
VVLGAAVIALSYSRFFEDHDTYYIEYKDVSVSGLDVGSPVKYLGIKVGTIDDIRIDPEDISSVIVEIKIKEGTPIKDDVRAEIVSVGITGLKVIELRGGSKEANLLKPGEYIKAGKSFTENITGKAEVIAEKMEIVLNNLAAFTSSDNQNKIMNVINETGDAVNRIKGTVDNINTVLDENEASLNSSLRNIDTLSADFVEIGKSTRSTVETIQNIVESDTFKTTIRNLSRISKSLEEADLTTLISRLNQSVVKVNKILNQTDAIVVRNRSKIVESINDLNETVKYLNQTARMINENPSVLIGGANPVNPPDEKLER